MDNAKLEACIARLNYHPPIHQLHLDDNQEAKDLTKAQDESLLNLLWQSFHCVYPVLSEPDFGEYHASLWSSDSTTTRKPSALVDVLSAVCMQYSSTFFGDPWRSNLASQAYYRRAQGLLQTDINNPSILTVQSHIYSIVYLYNTSMLNTAYINLGSTLGIAHTLRLHLRPDGRDPFRAARAAPPDLVGHLSARQSAFHDSRSASIDSVVRR